jgi:23S rRNA (adenine2503-C2)-methyltransferase
MKILVKAGKPDLAEVYLAEFRGDPGLKAEFVDACASLGGDRRDKWVIIVSTQFGCPAGCLMCDAGGGYLGDLTAGEMAEQARAVFRAHPELDPKACRKLKIQFARMGEPALNDEVLETIGWLSREFPDCIPCVATLAPAGREDWFASLLELRDRFREFQLQLSINTTDPGVRDQLMPMDKLPLEWLADYGREFHRPGSRRPVLNFALSDSIPLDPEEAARIFEPEWFAVKLTPLNPTLAAAENELKPFAGERDARELVELRAAQFEGLGYQVIRSVGEWEENRIGSNCGQLAARLLGAEQDKSPA